MKKILTMAAIGFTLACASAHGADKATLPSGYGPNGPAQNTWQPDSDMKKVFEESRHAMDNMPPGIKAQAEHDRAKVLRNTYQERDQVMKLLHIDPSKVGYVYYFVSESMPDTMMYRYAMDSIWIGGILDFNGINPKHDIPWFVSHVMSKYMRHTDSSPTMSLDPRLFQAFGVTAVPTIVYSTVAPNRLCEKKIVKTYVTDDGRKVPYRVCAPMDPDKYWKISGAVSTQYALEQFKEAGAPGADKLLKQLAVGLSQGKKLDIMTKDDYQQASGPGAIGSTMQLITNNRSGSNFWNSGIGLDKHGAPMPSN